jgi:hypothetical protein
LQGASATGQLLREFNSQDLRVLVIWEPVLPTDFVRPVDRRTRIDGSVIVGFDAEKIDQALHG